MLHSSICRGLGALFGGLSPQKPPVATGLQRSLSKEIRYTPKFFIDNVSAKLKVERPQYSEKVDKWSWIRMWVFIRQLLTIIANCLINQRFQNIFELEWNLSLVNILSPKLQTAYVNMTKMLIVWMIFGIRLLSSFSMSAFHSFFNCLRYTTNRHRQVWKFSIQV